MLSSLPKGKAFQLFAPFLYQQGRQGQEIKINLYKHIVFDLQYGYTEGQKPLPGGQTAEVYQFVFMLAVIPTTGQLLTSKL